MSGSRRQRMRKRIVFYDIQFLTRDWQMILFNRLLLRCFNNLRDKYSDCFLFCYVIIQNDRVRKNRNVFRAVNRNAFEWRFFPLFCTNAPMRLRGIYQSIFLLVSTDSRLWELRDSKNRIIVFTVKHDPEYRSMWLLPSPVMDTGFRLL